MRLYIERGTISAELKGGMLFPEIEVKPKITRKSESDTWHFSSSIDCLIFSFLSMTAIKRAARDLDWR